MCHLSLFQGETINEIIRLHEVEGYTQHQIEVELKIGKHTVSRVLKRRQRELADAKLSRDILTDLNAGKHPIQICVERGCSPQKVMDLLKFWKDMAELHADFVKRLTKDLKAQIWNDAYKLGEQEAWGRLKNYSHAKGPPIIIKDAADLFKLRQGKLSDMFDNPTLKKMVDELEKMHIVKERLRWDRAI